MTKPKHKNDLIKAIIKLTAANPEEDFDTLTDSSEEYLEKLLKVIKGL